MINLVDAVHPYMPGHRVLVARGNEATFQSFGRCRKAGDYSTWTDDPPRPWFPHGEHVRVTRVDDAYLFVVGSDGTEWQRPVPFWAVSPACESSMEMANKMRLLKAAGKRSTP